ncbi:MAG TPA: serine/threonine-protein kinase, partial [Gemmataceae bacterium]|nr:serine/threonine-protein kinase [Gemmataceae bacterium]
MSDPSSELSIDAAASVWDALGDRLEAFAREWDAGTPPDPAAFVPASPPAARRLVLVELLKFDLDQRLQRGLDRPLEDLLAAFPELAADPPCDLIYEDFQLRRAAGRQVRTDDYFRRFPDQAAELERLLGSATQKTSAVNAARVPDIQPGESLDDFDLLALLGAGTFAKVFLARQRGMQRLVALKVSGGKAAEAETLAQLDHPNIVRVYDQRYLDDRKLLLVYMPYLAGGTLLNVLERVRVTSHPARSGKTLLEAVDEALERRGELPPAASGARAQWAARTWTETVCALGAKLASALDYAHSHGVLHRDLKPANVLLSAEGEPLLADFNVGVCSKLDGANPRAFFGGSMAYMSLEHLEAFDPSHPRKAEDLDGRADLFSLAVTLWELLTGARPFGPESVGATWSRTVAALVEKRRNGPPPEAVALFPDDVPGFRDVLLRCLDPDPDKRPRTAGEMAHELELCLRPATRELVRPAKSRWRELFLRYPALAVYPAGLIPNGIASWFNTVYNRDAIIGRWSDAARECFWPIVAVVNGVAFPVGMLIVGVALWPVLRGLAKLRRGEAQDAEQLAQVRQRVLRLGSITALTCATCWVVVGVIWPVTLRVVAGAPQTDGLYIHFGLTLVLCGLIAAAAPYFLITFLAVRVLYPALIGPDGASDRTALEGVGREMSQFR